MSARAALAAAAALLAACGDDAAPTDAGPDPCAPPALDAPWLAGALADHVAALAAAPRALASEREAARVYLAAQLAALGWTAERHDYPGGQNVFATIPATVAAPGLAIIAGAHFDTVPNSPGASDNATGAAVVLALARYLAEAPCRGAPVVVAFFDQEEIGLFGARAFALRFPPAQVRAVHTIDQVGWDADGDRRFELEQPTPALEAAWRAAAQALGVTIAVTTTAGTDHEAFRDAGHAAVGLTEEYTAGDTSPHRHLPSDTAATVDLDYLGLAARLTARVVLDELAL